MHHKLTEILKKTVDEQNLFPPGEMIVLGVSGGSDSLALLHALAQPGQTLTNRYHIATLDHGLRGDAGAADAAFVCEQAQQLGLPCTRGEADVLQMARERRIGIEEAARSARYDFLGNVATHVGSRTIATGHNTDDQAETILMHVLRGAGLQGLRGMPYQTDVPGHPGLRLVRPLLDVPRAIIEAYCQKYRLQPRSDETNADPTYTRNRVRLEILPRLREINPQIERALIRLAKTAHEDEGLLSEMFQREILPQIDQHPNRSGWRIESFRGWHPAMQARALRYALERLDAHPEYEAIIRARDLALAPTVGMTMPFNSQVRLRFSYETMWIEREDASLPREPYLLLENPRVVTLSDTTDCGLWQLIASDHESPTAVARMSLPPDAQIALRTRQPADRWQPLGMGGRSRRLKKWMIDRKIPQHVRDHLPLLTVDGRIAAVILPNQWAIAHPFAVKPTSQHVFYFSVRRL